MILIIYLFSLLFAGIIAWSSSIYYLVLYWGRNKKKPYLPTQDPIEDIFFHIVIPCFQEEEYILDKLKNTAALKYPESLLRIYIVDGGSSDHTQEITRDFCAQRPNFQLLVLPRSGKIPKINLALEKINHGIVMVTDVDGRMEQMTLHKLNKLYAQPQIGCAGAFVIQRDTLPEDAIFWEHQNAMRLVESYRGHSSVMVAVAYSFRRSLFQKFPDNVIGDDVYVAFSSNTQGYKSIYCPWIRAEELRSGSTLSQMFRHKLRKLNSNMRELNRFLPQCLEMKGVWRIMFLTKFAQSWLTAPFFMALIFLFILSVCRIGLHSFYFWGGLLLILVVIQSYSQRVLHSFLSSEARQSFGIRKRCNYVLLFAAILIVGFFRFFLISQTSDYNKVK